MELLVSMILLSILILYYAAIENIVNRDILGITRWDRVESDASFALEHMARQVTGADGHSPAMGNINQPAIDFTPVSSNPAIRIWVDTTNDGQPDRQIAYAYSANEIRFYPDASAPGTFEVLTAGTVMPDFNQTAGPDNTYVTYNNTNNFLEVQFTTCFNPAGNPDPCSRERTARNPMITMRNRIMLPSYSTN